MSSKGASGTGGWPLVGLATLAILACVAGAVLSIADPVEAVRSVIRITARFSVALFLLAFTAAALWRFWPNGWTRWQRQNRRYLGVSFAVSHFIHLIAIGMLRELAPAELAAEANAITWIFGGLAYAFIAAMAFTSFDRTARMIGPRAWTILHTTGSYYIWIIFANSYFARAVMSPEYIPIAVIIVAALGLRIAARIARSRAPQAAAAN